MVLANDTMSADKWEQLPKITGSVCITHQALGELEESHAEKPEIHTGSQTGGYKLQQLLPQGSPRLRTERQPKS